MQISNQNDQSLFQLIGYFRQTHCADSFILQVFLFTENDHWYWYKGKHLTSKESANTTPQKKKAGNLSTYNLSSQSRDRNSTGHPEDFRTQTKSESPCLPHPGVRESHLRKFVFSLQGPSPYVLSWKPRRQHQSWCPEGGSAHSLAVWYCFLF